MRIIAMQLHHLGAVLRNETRSYAYPWTEGTFRDCLAGQQECWVAIDSAGRVIGHAVTMHSVGEAHLLNLCICRDHQGQGFGRTFLRFLVDEATAAECEVLFLEVRPSNRSATALYESLGFREIGLRKDYYPAPLGREDARVMALSLADAPLAVAVPPPVAPQ
ncbi:MAG: ribosomal protein S18-alanine N-acetyltransferase [Pseudomonadota bacterium]